MKKDILLVGSDNKDLTTAKRVLEAYDFTVDLTCTGIGAINHVQSTGYCAVVLGDDLEDKSTKELLRKLLKISPYTEYVIYSSGTDFFYAKELVNLGATGFATKGDYSELKRVIKNKIRVTHDMDCF